MNSGWEIVIKKADFKKETHVMISQWPVSLWSANSDRANKEHKKQWKFYKNVE